jgi:solute carrier family 35, member F5
MHIKHGCCAGLFDNALADYLWSRAVLLVGPTIATVGMQLQVPIAMVVDPLVHTRGWWSVRNVCMLELLGAAAILGGFFTIDAQTSASL